MINKQNKDMLVGGLVMLVIASLLMFSKLNASSGLTASTTSYPVKAVFNRVDGLFEGDEVRLGGIKVGTVGTQVLNADFRAEVILNMDLGIEIPIDSAAAIHTDGLFGSKFIVLEPGVEDGILQAGSEILYTQGAVVVSELLSLIIAEGKSKQKKSATQQGGN